MAGYLYLFYDNYVNYNHINAIDIINETKQSIQSAAINKLKTASANSFAAERDFQQLYNLDGYEIANPIVSARLKQTNLIMADYDAAATELKNLLAEGKDVTRAISEGSRIIQDMDRMLLLGAQTGGLGASACQELISAKSRMKQILYKLKYIEKHGSAADMASMTKGFSSDIMSNASGYLLELAHVYAFIGSGYVGLKNIHDAMINIGGHGEGLRMLMKQDPSIKSDIQKLKQSLSSTSAQSQADVVFLTHIDETGNGTVSITGTWTGFQDKNVADISRIGLRPYSLGDIDILNYYPSDFLVNVAGTYAGTQYQNKNIPSALNRNPHFLQKDVNQYWAKIKASTKILGIVDAIGQSINGGIAGTVNYYVIRSKQNGGMIRVIPVSEILNQIIRGYTEEGKSKIGVNDDTSNESTRQEYIDINANAFSLSKTPQERSAEAYSQVLEKILNTKIVISINFSQWF